MKIYVASSWRNSAQPTVVRELREIGLDVYDFRNPTSDNHGFHWSSIDKNWQSWNGAEYIEALDHPIAIDGFRLDREAMEWADACVLCLPCGRSAHLEAGYFVGVGKKLLILLTGDIEPELMYRMADHISLDIDDLKCWITAYCAPTSI